jgi:hypothetical protein
MTRTRTAQTADEATPAPAKKTPTKRATPTKPRTRAPRKTPPTLSLVKTRTPLPARNKPFMTDIQGYATLAARIVGIHTPHIRDWNDHGDHTATRPLQDGTLHYNQKTRTLTWQATCRMGAVHTYLLDSPSTAAAARIQAATCQQIHADLSTVQRLTTDELEALGLLQTPTWARNDLLGDDITETIPVPLPDRKPRALADQLAHSGSSTDDTHPLSLGDIAEGLAARAQDADTETPKEHPQP